MIHLLACVSSHGWGHLAQTLPMLAALRARLPGLRVTVRCGLDPAVLRSRFAAAGQPAPAIVGDDTDFGFVMHDALHVDDAQSLLRYAALHADGGWLERERAALRALRVDAVLSNIGYMPLAAAASLGVPAFGACSLNWADVLGAMYADRPHAAPIVRAMRAAYAQADLLFALEPGMPFEGFERRVPIDPIARRGRARRDALRAALGVPAGQRIMQVAFGGLPMAFDTARWRLPDGWTAVALTAGVVETEAVRDARSLEGWSYIDLLASCDLLVAKPGYGTFAEAGFEGRDTLAVPRDTWPESPWLIDWLSRHARCAPIGLADLRAGRFEAALAALGAQPPRAPARGDGAAQIAQRIAERLGAPPGPVSPPGTGGRTPG
jgi:hypothetical protein